MKVTVFITSRINFINDDGKEMSANNCSIEFDNVDKCYNSEQHHIIITGDIVRKIPVTTTSGVHLQY